MSANTLSRAGPAATLAAKVQLGDEALALLQPQWTARQYLEALLSAGHLRDAIRYLAWALPRREAVWWACQCVSAAVPPEEGSPNAEALEAAQRWASSATEDHRRAAFAAGEAVNFETPAGLAALAAFWSGGSQAPPKLPAVLPAEHLCPNAVSNAVLLAGVLREPEKAEEKYRVFLGLGDEVAQGINRWKEGPAPTGRR
jgi:hypothetical protein